MNCAEHDQAAREHAPRRIGARPRREQALHEELIGALHGERQDHPADQPGPQRVDLARVPDRIDDGELAGGHAGVDDGAPAAVDVRQQRRDEDAGAEEVDEQLDHVGPDDGRGAAAHRVGDHHDAEDDDDRADRDARHHGDHQRRRIQADAVGERARADEQPGAEVLDRRPEALPQQVVGGQQIAGEVGRHQQHARPAPGRG